MTLRWPICASATHSPSLGGPRDCTLPFGSGFNVCVHTRVFRGPIHCTMDTMMPYQEKLNT
eukprot:1633849-Karenia_brevis.AAC.1